jgi:hypothetical protein
LETTKIFNATVKNKLVATITLIKDGVKKLPIDSIAAECVKPYRIQNLNVAEVCSLVSETKTFRHLLELLRLMVQYAKYCNINIILAMIQSHHIKFYEKYLAFTTIGKLRQYSYCFCGAVPMCLDLDAIEQNPPKNYGRFFGEPIKEDIFKANLPHSQRMRLRKLATTMEV